MGPEQKRPSLEGVTRRSDKRQPEYRPERELPAPAPTTLIEAHEPAEMPPIALSEEVPGRHAPLAKWLLLCLAGFVTFALIAGAAGYAWYQQQLRPASDDTSKRVRVKIVPGSGPSMIAGQLESQGIIRNRLAFSIYARLSGAESKFRAGTYSLQPSLSTPTIIDHLVSGKEDTFTITFLPGDTLANARKKLLGLGYSVSDVDSALNRTYDRPLFATRPTGADLEGYIFGETIQFDSSATVEQILNRFFDEYEAVIKENKLLEAFQKQGLTLYEGITLASIVQREVPGFADQRQVARVFLNRMKAGMTLGSDVTYQYAAKKLGVAPDPTLDSPYNTRIHAGLPPGPIASPGASALLAVANPASNEYLFFLSGDDDVTYFAKTDAEHQRNIVSHCQKKCAIN